MPDVVISIVSHPSGDPEVHARMLDECINSVRSSTCRVSYRFVLTNNLAEVDVFGRMRALLGDEDLVSNSCPAGFAANHNRVAERCAERYLFVLNDDTCLLDGGLDHLVGILDAHPRAAMVGPAVFRDREATKQEATAGTRIITPERALLWRVLRETPLIGKPWLQSIYQEVEIPTGPRRVLHLQGAALLVRRTAYLEAGGMDEGYGMYREETDLCLQLGRRAWEIRYEPGARLIHLGGQSTRATVYREQYLRSLDRFLAKYFGWRATLARGVLPPLLATVRMLRRLLRAGAQSHLPAG